MVIILCIDGFMGVQILLFFSRVRVFVLGLIFFAMRNNAVSGLRLVKIKFPLSIGQVKLFDSESAIDKAEYVYLGDMC